MASEGKDGPPSWGDLWGSPRQCGQAAREHGGVRPLGDRQEKMLLGGWTSEVIINCVWD